MKRFFITLSFGVSAMLLAADHAFAQQTRCAARAAVVAQLADRYGESRQAIGLSSANQMLEIFASDATGSWTITLTRPGGPTCLVAAGQGFQLTLDDRPDDDSGA